MAPEKLRNLSLRLFKTAVYCGITGIIIFVAIPNASYKGGTGAAVHIIAFLSLGLIGIMFLSCMVSMVSGGIAWFRGTKHCSWIFVCALVLFGPLILWFIL